MKAFVASENVLVVGPFIAVPAPTLEQTLKICDAFMLVVDMLLHVFSPGGSVPAYRAFIVKEI